MLFGQHTLAFSADHTLALPKSYLNDFSGGVFLTQGFDRNLLLLPEKVFGEIVQRITALNMADPLARMLLRLLLGNAIQIEAGQPVTIPLHLIQFAGLDDTAIMVGQGNYAEVWSASQWEMQNHDLQDAEVNAHRFASLNLAV